jgi:hypothetical protein
MNRPKILVTGATGRTPPFVRVPNTRRHVRGLHIAAPAAPQYSGESAAWRREHSVAETALRPSAAAPSTFSPAA